MQIKEILTTKELGQIKEILAQIYANFDEKNFSKNLKKMSAEGYKLAAIFEQSTDEPYCLAIIGIKPTYKLKQGTTLEIEDFAVVDDGKKDEISTIALQWVEQQAKKLKCQKIAVSILTKNAEAQRLFSNKKFSLDAFLFQSA